MRKTCLDEVYKLAQLDPRVVFIGSDLGPGVLSEMQAEMPDRFFMEGVSEANIIGMAAGLAMEGFIPYVNTIATFITRRCYEQVALDLCLHNLPVRLIGNGGGVVYAPLGPTHLAVEDIAIMRALPNMTIVAPVDKEEMARFMPASLNMQGPLYIRLARGGDPIVSSSDDSLVVGRAIEMRPIAPVTFIATGIMTNRALDAAAQLATTGITCGVIHMHTLKPIDAEMIIRVAQGARLIVSLEEHSRIGGLGSAIAETLMDHAPTPMPRLIRMALPDSFATDYGRQDTLLESMGLGLDEIMRTVRDGVSKLD